MIERLTQFINRRPRQRDRAEGVEHLQRTGVHYIAPEINANLIRDLEDNAYFSKLKLNQKNLIFSDVAEITVKDEAGEVDDDLSAIVRAMATGPEVKINVRMRQIWGSIWDYGAGFLNCVWGWRGPEYRLLAMRHLPAYTFSVPPPSQDFLSQSEILRGVVLSRDGEIEFWQQQSEAEIPRQLQNVIMIKDPEEHDIAGRPGCLPAIPIINMLKFCHKMQMQKINRVGAPPIFPKITEPKNRGTAGSDVSYLNTLLQNWGANIAFQLRDNMEFVDPYLHESECALETIRHLEVLLDKLFSPSTLIAKDGTLIGGSTSGELELMQAYIAGIHRWLEGEFEAILDHYLEVNQYDGYHTEIVLPLPSLSLMDLEMRQAEAAHKTGVATLDEIRALLHLPPATDEIRAEIEAQRPAQPPDPFGLKAPPTPEKVEEETEDDLEKAIDAAFRKVIAALEADDAAE